MDIKPIRTPADHAAALKEIERLWDKAQPGTPEGEKFEVLSTLVDAYEREHIEIPTPDPIEAIRFRMEQEGLTTKDLAAHLQDAGPRLGGHGQEAAAQPADDPAPAREALDPHRVPREGLQAEEGRRRTVQAPLIAPVSPLRSTRAEVAEIAAAAVSRRRTSRVLKIGFDEPCVRDVVLGVQGSFSLLSIFAVDFESTSQTQSGASVK